MRIGLAGRVLLGAAIPTVLAVAAFATMIVSVGQLRDAQSRAARSQGLVIAAEQLSRAVGELVAAARAPGSTLDAAEQAVALRSRELSGMVATDAGQRARVAAVTTAAQDYVTAIRSAGRGSSREFTARLDTFLDAERDAVARQQDAADAATERAVAAAGTGLISVIIAIIGLGLYLTRSVALPVRRASAVARRFADGDLGARLPATGAGEVHDLQHSLNDMATALAAAQHELAASRSRIVAATWQARRELERNLHDGLQQRLVALSLDVRTLIADLPDDAELRAQGERLGAALAEATEELREIARGIQPAVLTESGLRAALRALGRRSALPVEVDVDLPERPAPDIESAAYYFCSEAVTNAIKHAGASYVAIDVRAGDAGLRVTVRDDGAGGATSTGGTGLLGLRDRVEAAGGRMSIESEPGHGTTLTAHLPLA